MDYDENFPEEGTKIGSDELLSDDHLRLPEEASPLVRVHAIRAWLTRRQKEGSLEIGEIALSLQQLMQDESQGISRPRRRASEGLTLRLQQAQHELHEAQERVRAYEEAEELLEECVTHTTMGERLLVEYYLSLEDKLHDAQSEKTLDDAWSRALLDVLNRIEHVSMPATD